MMVDLLAVTKAIPTVEMMVEMSASRWVDERVHTMVVYLVA